LRWRDRTGLGVIAPGAALPALGPRPIADNMLVQGG
jgi:hypothetical protein